MLLTQEKLDGKYIVKVVSAEDIKKLTVKENNNAKLFGQI